MSGRLAVRVRPTGGVAARGKLGGDRTLKAAGGGCAGLGHLPGRVVGGGGGGRGVGFKLARVVHFHLPSIILLKYRVELVESCIKPPRWS